MSAFIPLILALHAATTVMMTGLVWFVHAVHYPMFTTAAEAGDEHWKRFEKVHLRRTTPIIPPIMLIELVTAIVLVAYPVDAVPRPMVWLATAMLGIVWVSTFFGAVPMHTKLSTGFTPSVHHWLMRFNLIRAIAWTGRSVVALLMLMHATGRMAEVAPA